jgi:adenylyltransferase/sulfurtransferase
LRFSELQAEQFSRHILLKEIGVAGQRKLLTTGVFVVGAGGLGSASLIYLAAAGIGRLGVADGDRVELSNLQRQILHSQADLGKEKVVSAKETINQINPDCRVEIFSERLTAGNIRDVVKDYDLVLDGSDNFATRFLVADHCWFEKIPLVSAAVIGFEGQLLSVIPGQGNPCYRCFIPEPPDIAATCGDAGVLGPAVGVMGSLQAVEAIKTLLGIGENLSHHLLIYKALKGEFRNVRRPVDPACPLCSSNPAITSLIEYGVTCHG